MAWVLITLKQYPIFSRLWIHEAFLYDMKKTLGMNFKRYKSLYSGTYADSEEIEKLKIILIKKLENNINSIWKLCENWKKDCDNLIQYTQKIEKTDFSEYSDKELINITGDVIKKFRKSASYIYLSTALEQYFHDFLDKLLDKKLKDKSKKIDYFQSLSSPVKNTKLLEAKNDLIKIAKIVRAKGIKKAKNQIKDYTKKYKWLCYDTGIGKNLTEEEAKSKLNSTINQKIQNIKRKSRDSIIKELKLSKKEKDLVELIAEMIYVRTYRAESHMIAGSYIRPLIEELAKRFRTDYENIVQLTFDEIKKSIFSKKIDFNEIERRKYKYGLLMINGKNKIYSGDDVNYIKEEVKVPVNIQELKGLVANQGKVKGFVKIVSNMNDLNKVNSGDILVTKMTNPHYIVALEKCCGIVTDIGGITCHAAIIARELKKPCIIGTKYATSIFKDGDLIELDANKGIVRKIK